MSAPETTSCKAIGKLKLQSNVVKLELKLSHPNYARRRWRRLSSEIVRKSTRTPNNPSGPSKSTPRHMPRFPVSPRPRPNGLLLLEPLAPREALFAAARNFEPNLEDIAPKTNVLMGELWIHLTRFEQYLLGGATIHGGLRQGCLRRWLWIWAPTPETHYASRRCSNVSRIGISKLHTQMA